MSTKKVVKDTEFIKVTVTGLTIDPFTNMPIIILKDDGEKNELPIWIGLIEASAIATELEKVDLSRPMTHDLLKNILSELDIKVLRIEVNDLQDNTFFANIHLDTKGKGMVIDSRPSDAIALALRTNAPIYVSKHVMEKSRKIDLSAEGINSEDSVKKEKWSEILDNLSSDDFGKYKM